MDGPRVTALDLQRYLDQIVRISTETDNKLRAEAEAELLTKTDSAGFIELLKSLFSDEHASKTAQGRLQAHHSDQVCHRGTVQELREEEHQTVQIRASRVLIPCCEPHSVQSKLFSRCLQCTLGVFGSGYQPL